MAQGAEDAGGRIIKGHGADARHAVPNPGTDAVDTLVVLGGGDRERHAPAVPADLEVRLRVPVLLKKGLELLRGGHRGSAALHDHISGTQSTIPGGRAAVGELHHHHAPGKQLDAHRMPNRHQHPGGLI